MQLITILNPEHVSEEEIAKFRVRESVRAVVYDKDGNIGILNVLKERYHKLPGGGIESGENNEEALRRECREEIGCDIEIRHEVGQIIEYRKIFQIKQTSFFYLADIVGEKRQPSYTSEEADKGFQVEWLSPEEARQILASDQPLSDEGRLYIVPRDKALLNALGKR